MSDAPRLREMLVEAVSGALDETGSHRLWTRAQDVVDALDAYLDARERGAPDPCDHVWVTDGFGPTHCASCGRTSGATPTPSKPNPADAPEPSEDEAETILYDLAWRLVGDLLSDREDRDVQRAIAALRPEPHQSEGTGSDAERAILEIADLLTDESYSADAVMWKTAAIIGHIADRLRAPALRVPEEGGPSGER